MFALSSGTPLLSSSASSPVYCIIPRAQTSPSGTSDGPVRLHPLGWSFCSTPLPAGTSYCGVRIHTIDAWDVCLLFRFSSFSTAWRSKMYRMLMLLHVAYYKRRKKTRPIPARRLEIARARSALANENIPPGGRGGGWSNNKKVNNCRLRTAPVPKRASAK